MDTPGYLVCATPRTGSPHLCSLLRSSGRLGRPESYFRAPDEALWAGRLGLDPAPDRRRFVAAVRSAATTENGVFGARVMWSTLERLLELRDPPHETDAALLERVLGVTHFVHLRRADVVAQAVSWSRAEQTGFWQPGDAAAGEPTFSPEQLRDLVATITAHERAWAGWFAEQGIEPLELVYEEVTADGPAAVRAVAAHLGVGLDEDVALASPYERQATRSTKRGLSRRARPSPTADAPVTQGASRCVAQLSPSRT